MVVIALYYDHAWRRLKNTPHSVASVPITVSTNPPATDKFIERDYLYKGLAITILCFLLAGSADTPATPLDHLIGALMGLCGAIFAATFAVGLVSLWNLWRDSISQLKYRLYLQRLARSNPQAQSIKTGSFLFSIPIAIFWLAMGLTVLILAGMLVDKIPSWLHSLVREGLFFLIAAMFYGLWKSGSRAAATLRFFLLSVFSTIMIAALFFAVAWAVSETAPLLVALFAAITALHAVFYARWVRLKALINNLE
jgi:hypothetical protein